MVSLATLNPFRPHLPVVSVLRLTGIIGQVGGFRTGITLAGIAQQIERAFALRGQKAVALVVNSPGGSPVQSSLVARRIRQLAEERQTPVLAFTEDVAASGGYWLACAADEIYADEGSIVGSIGVVSAGFGLHEFIRRHGIERRLYTSGDRKAMLDPFRPELPEEVARLKAIQAEIHECFKAMVRARRGSRLKAPEAELFSGEFWTGRRALELGLVDGLGDMRSVLRAKYGDQVRLRVLHRERRWLFRPRLRPEALSAASSWSDELAGALLAAVEERALWARFGL